MMAAPSPAPFTTCTSVSYNPGQTLILPNSKTVLKNVLHQPKPVSLPNNIQSTHTNDWSVQAQ